MIALQSPEQLDDKYGKSKSKIIREAIQVRMYSHLSGNEVAQELSKEMGNYTISTGSATSSNRRDGDSSSRSLTGRALMTHDEIAAMPIGDWLVLANDLRPIRAHMRPYSEFWKLPSAKFAGEPRPVVEIPYLTEAKLRERYVNQQHAPSAGMFDVPLSEETASSHTGFRRKSNS